MSRWAAMVWPLTCRLAKRGLSLPRIAGRLKVSPSTARRWFHEAGLELRRTSLRNRPLGSAAPVHRPTCSELYQLYVDGGLSIAAMSPALLRLRAAARDQFLAAAVADYRDFGSTRVVADRHNCAPDTVRRWLAAAGVAVPGRGQWPRRR